MKGLVAIAVLLTGAVAMAEEAGSAPSAASAPVAALAGDGHAFAEDATAREILETCRRMVPAEVEIRGHVNRRTRHGTLVAAYHYVLTRRHGKTEVAFTDKDGRQVAFEPHGRLLDTDVTWSDLTMDYLWWDDVSFDESAPASMLGFVCKVLLVKQGKRAFRAWVDRRTGAMVAAKELRLVDGGWKPVREIFCTSLKDFDGRWAPRNIEVGPEGAKLRTKIVVEEVR